MKFSLTETLKQAQSLMQRDYVYHVANPDVRGVVEGSIPGTARVRFEMPVEFSGNPGRKSTVWDCSEHLLFSSKEDAWKNKKY